MWLTSGGGVTMHEPPWRSSGCVVLQVTWLELVDFNRERINNPSQLSHKSRTRKRGVGEESCQVCNPLASVALLQAGYSSDRHLRLNIMI